MRGTKVPPAALELALTSRIAVRAVTLPIFTSSFLSHRSQISVPSRGRKACAAARMHAAKPIEPTRRIRIFNGTLPAQPRRPAETTLWDLERYRATALSRCDGEISKRDLSTLSAYVRMALARKKQTLRSTLLRCLRTCGSEAVSFRHSGRPRSDLAVE